MMPHTSGVHGLTLRRSLSGRVSPFSVVALGVQFRRNIVPSKRSVSRVFLLSVHKNVAGHCRCSERPDVSSWR